MTRSIFALAPDQRIDFTHQRLGVEIERIRLDERRRTAARRPRFLFGFAAALRLLEAGVLVIPCEDIVQPRPDG